MKKVYLFYIHDTEVNKSLYPGCDDENIENINNQEITLYAWTTDKTCRKKFKKLRNMDLFYEQVHEFDDSEFEKFAEENNDLLLADRALTTKFISDGKFIKDIAFILSTRKETDYVIFKSDEILDEIFGEIDYNFELNEFILFPELYKKKYKEVISSLCFDDLISRIINPVHSTEIDTDSLAMFIHVFQNTYKKDGAIKCKYGSSLKSLMTEEL